MKKTVWPLLIVVALVLCAAGVFAFSLGGKYEKVKQNNGTITVPVAKLADGKARFYKFDDGGKEITFFAVKSADGSYKTAFDACDACYKSKKDMSSKATR